MALGDGGLDAQVEQRMDAYRGNPQQLQKRYGQNKELLDLMALQKLKKEKEDTARDMQLKAQQNPDTIAQQREQEVLELVKGEMGGTLGELTGRTASTLGQKQKTQQKNMGRMAQNAGKPKMGGGAGLAGLMGGAGRPPQARPPMPPQAQGLAGARMAQAAAQQGGPRRINNGGIVGFAEGEGVSGQGGLRSKIFNMFSRPNAVTQEDIDAYRQRVRSKAPLSDDQIRKILEASSADPLNLAGPKPMNLSGNLSEDSTETISQPLGVTTGPMLEIPEGGIQELLPPSKQKQQTNQNLPTVTEVVSQPTVDESPSLPTSDGSSAPQVDIAKVAGNVGLDYEDPNAALERGFAMSDAYTGRAEKGQKYDDMLAELKAFDAENYDPDKERNDRLKAFLMGAAGTTNIGSTMASAGTASMNLENSQRKNRRTRMMDKFQLEQNKMTTDTGLAQSGLTLGKELYSQASQSSRTAMTLAVQMRGQNLQNAQNNADRILRKIEADNTQSYRAATLAMDKNKLDAQILNNENATKEARIKAANDTIFRTLQVREMVILEAQALSGVDVAKAELENAKLMGYEPEEIVQAQKAYEAAAALAIVTAESMMNKFGRGIGEDGELTGTSLLDVEQTAISILARYGLDKKGQPITKNSVRKVTTSGN